VKHDCLQQGNGNEYLWLCSRCGGCYVCKHKLVPFGDGTLMWKCKDGKFREVILDGRKYER
jgi:hypothetical protein